MADLDFLKAFTSARIAIGRVGTSIPVRESLEFKLAHAHARDAVYSSLDLNAIVEDLKQFNLPVLSLHSKAADRIQYLQRPDFGRHLNDNSIRILSTQITGKDVAICIADGLSAVAISKNVTALLQQLLPALLQAGFSLAPISIVQLGRVAIADDIGENLKAKLALILIGERPGLSASDSMGAYLTYQPKRGLTDDSRNCISNIRHGGLDAQSAAAKIFYLIHESFQQRLSGVTLKDNFIDQKLYNSNL